MDCKQAGKQREREEGKERGNYVENDMESRPHLGAMCTACYMAIEIKIEHE